MTDNERTCEIFTEVLKMAKPYISQKGKAAAMNFEKQLTTLDELINEMEVAQITANKKESYYIGLVITAAVHWQQS